MEVSSDKIVKDLKSIKYNCRHQNCPSTFGAIWNLKRHLLKQHKQDTPEQVEKWLAKEQSKNYTFILYLIPILSILIERVNPIVQKIAANTPKFQFNCSSCLNSTFCNAKSLRMHLRNLHHGSEEKIEKKIKKEKGK